MKSKNIEKNKINFVQQQTFSPTVKTNKILFTNVDNN